MKSKKAMTIQTVMILVIFLFSFTLLIAVNSKALFKVKTAISTSACTTQIAVASQGNPIGFSGCHTYRLEFGKSSAIKYDMFDSDAILSEYKYSNVVKKLGDLTDGEFDGKLKSKEPIPDEIIYYILAEEMKRCGDNLYAPIIHTLTDYRSCDTDINTCHFCDLVLFNDDFVNLEHPLDGFGDFIYTTKISKDSTFSYYNYFKSKFGSKISFDDLLKVSNINDNNLYMILMQYVPDLELRVTEELLGVDWLDKDSKPYIKPTNVMFINLDEQVITCDYFLTLGPKSC